ncbi:MAG: tetratricopeptide repeat protein [Nitrospirae bacterium]|nr:tetratricopeptide repeat protein [Nitrospirota bacterium]
MQSDSQAVNIKTAFPFNPIFHLILIAVIGLLAYSNTLNAPFYFDDAFNIVENPIIKDLQYFAEPSKAKEFPLYNTFKNRFIGYLAFALNYRLHGLDVTGYHIVNLSIHIINALLVYWLVLLTFFRVAKGQRDKVAEGQDSLSTVNGQQSINLIALFSALIFISHPIQTQAVTYIVQRFTSLATMFYLLSLVMYVKFRTQNIEHRTQNTDKRQKIFSLSSVFWYLGSVLSAVLAMKTKEIAFTLPIIIVLYEFVFFSPNSQAKACGYASRLTLYALRFLYLIPFLLTLLIIPLGIIDFSKSTEDLIESISETTKVQVVTISRWEYFFTQSRVIVTYIRLLFSPLNQNLDYDYPIYNSFLNPNVFLSFLLLLSILGLAVYLFYYSKNPLYEPLAPSHRPLSLPTGQAGPFDKGGIKGGRSPFTVHCSLFTVHYLRLTAFGLFWFFITLSVESSFIPIVDVIFEHRVYLPSIGLIIAFVSAVFYFSPYLSSFNLQPSSFLSHHASRITVLLLAAVVLSLSIAAYQRNAVWQDKVKLWEDVIRKSPGKARGYFQLGVAYFDKNDLTAATKYFEISKQSFFMIESHAYLGNIYALMGQYNKAINNFTIAIDKYDYAVWKDKTNNAYLYYNRGQAYYESGAINNAKEDFTIACQKGFDRGCYKLSGLTVK